MHSYAVFSRLKFGRRETLNRKKNRRKREPAFSSKDILTKDIWSKTNSINDSVVN